MPRLAWRESGPLPIAKRRAAAALWASAGPLGDVWGRDERDPEAGVYRPPVAARMRET